MIDFPSKRISEFLNFISEAESHYKYCVDEMKNQEKLTQDYLHSLELDDLNCSERSKIATKLAINRKDRRYYKDRVEELEPIITFFEIQKNRETLNKLKQVLGACRKEEGYHKNRTYIPKVLKGKEEDKNVRKN
jgi:hypothetical protein